jgi:GLPGLI family protein
MIKRIIFILFFISANAQEKVCITYKMERIVPEFTSNIEEIKLTNKYLENLKFELFFSKELSIFQQTNTLANEEILKRTAYVPDDAIIYIHNNKKYTENSEFVAKKNSFLIEEKFPVWQLHNESKMINDMKCYKATSKYTTDGKNSFDIIAWYCPNLPYSYGPDGIGGLPGVILFLQRGFEVYSATKIVKDCPKEIYFPDKIKILSYEEYSAYIKKLEEEMFQE